MTVYALDGAVPDIAHDCWIAPNADVIGRVRLMQNSSVWFRAVIRGDNDWISVGEGSNIQDACVLHTDPGLQLNIGAHCTIGHAAIVHGCTVGDGTMIGMGAIVLNRAKIGAHCLIGAHTLIPEGKEIPERSLVIGSPGKVVRSLSDDEVLGLLDVAASYHRNWLKFTKELKVL